MATIEEYEVLIKSISGECEELHKQVKTLQVDKDIYATRLFDITTRYDKDCREIEYWHYTFEKIITEIDSYINVLMPLCAGSDRLQQHLLGMVHALEIIDKYIKGGAK